MDDDLQIEVSRIINEPGMTWKVRRALLLALGVPEAIAINLIPEPPEGMPWHPGDY